MISNSQDNGDVSSTIAFLFPGSPWALVLNAAQGRLTMFWSVHLDEKQAAPTYTIPDLRAEGVVFNSIIGRSNYQSDIYNRFSGDHEIFVLFNLIHDRVKAFYAFGAIEESYDYHEQNVSNVEIIRRLAIESAVMQTVRKWKLQYLGHTTRGQGFTLLQHAVQAVAQGK